MQNIAFSIPKLGNTNGDRYVAKEISPYFLLAIADGVGSTDNPGFAADIVIQKVIDEVSKNPSIPFSQLFTNVKSALESAVKSESDAVLQTTLTVCIINGNEARIGHVGDARVYHLRGSGLITRTEDQTEIKRLIDEGIISPARAKKYPRKNVLLSVLASDREFDLFENKFEVAKKDRLIFCTDGFYKLISKQKIVELSLGSDPVDSLNDQLHAFATNSTERNDDCTVLIAQI